MTIPYPCPNFNRWYKDPFSWLNGLISNCKFVQNLKNLLNIFTQMEGFQEFEARRRKKFDKQVDSNVMMGSKGLDEGVDLWYWH